MIGGMQMGKTGIALFVAALIVCILFHISIVWALIFGLGVFLLDGIKKGFTLKELFSFMKEGVWTVRNIILAFVLIGMMTTLWRSAGTIPTIVTLASRVISPAIFLVTVFWLHCLISILTGTAFGTAATMGVIAMMLSGVFGIPGIWTGGAILSGCYFGDRWSPVSSSAMLVSEITETDLYGNLKRMLPSTLVPFLLSSILYAVIGAALKGKDVLFDVQTLFAGEFRLHWVCLIPAAAVLVCALFKMKMLHTLTVSSALALLISLFFQKRAAEALFIQLFSGFRAQDTALSALLNGGGIFSMITSMCVVMLSSAYAGVFRHTGALDFISGLVIRLREKTHDAGAFVISSALISMVACSQALSVMLTHQLCSGAAGSREREALLLENSAIVLAPLVPWGIAGGVPLAIVGATPASMLAAFFLYLLPIWTFIQAEKEKHGRKAV